MSACFLHHCKDFNTVDPFMPEFLEPPCSTSKTVAAEMDCNGRPDSRHQFRNFEMQVRYLCKVEATSIHPTLPIPLLQIGGFHIQSWEPPWLTRVITLVEQPHIDHGLLRQHLTLSPQHRTLVESYLAPYSTQRPCIEVPYASRSDDGLGRKYCLTVGGQRLPKEVRLLLFGKTHVEVDLKGSFYELVRRLSLSLLPQCTPLPTIDELRHLLASDPYIRAVREKCTDTIKRLPLRVINSTIDATYYYLNTIVQGTPGPVTNDVLRRLRAQSQALTERLLPQMRASHQIKQ